MLLAMARQRPPLVLLPLMVLLLQRVMFADMLTPSPGDAALVAIAGSPPPPTGGGESDSDDDNFVVFVPYRCLVAASVGSGVTLAAGPAVLSAVGFGASGVTAGSLASTWQATMVGGAVAKGSTFALLQSVSMGGLGLAQGVVVTSGLAVGFAAFCDRVGELEGRLEGLAVQSARWATETAVIVGGKVVELDLPRSLPSLLGTIASSVRREAPFAIESARQAASSLGGRSWQTASSAAKGVGQKASDVAGSAWQKVPSAESARQAASSLGGSAWQKVPSAESAKQVASSLGGWSWQAASSTAEGAGQKASAAAGSAWQKVPSAESAKQAASSLWRRGSSGSD